MNKIYARKCEIKEVELSEAKLFLNAYHIQKATKHSPINIGLYFDNNLVQLMTFGKPRYNLKYDYELLRLCTKKDCNVIGGASKLLNYFEKKIKPNSIISYCDLSKFTGKIYEILGFKLLRISIGKHWWNGQRHITDNLLRKLGVDKLLGTTYGKGSSNEEIMRNMGFVEIYDKGQATYIKTY